MSSEQSAVAGSSRDGADDRGEEDRRALIDNSDNGTLEPLYDQLLKLSFPDSVTAIEHCRQLCAQFGFTVKQEASTHRNIYVYCSREGQPDSQRNPKTNPPKRKRPSKRCECRWRVILHERDGRWEFRKSLNPEAASHNHELLPPNEIDRNWPKAVIDLIKQLAREESSTANIRTKVQTAFPDLVWNERRFYNRLSEERQKIRQRDTVARAHHLTGLWSRVCMASAGNKGLSDYVEAEMNKLLLLTCEMARMDPTSLHAPVLKDLSAPQKGNLPRNNSTDHGKSTTVDQGSTPPTLEPKGKGKAVAKSVKPPDPPKGFVSVEIPRHMYFIKVHSQRIANEIRILNGTASSDTVFTTPLKRFRTSISSDTTNTTIATTTATTTTTTAAIASAIITTPPPLPITSTGNEPAATSATHHAQHHQQQQHYVQQHQHGVNDFMYSYNASLNSLDGPYSQNFQHHHQQTFMQPAMFGAQTALHQHDQGLAPGSMAAAAAAAVTQQQPSTRNIQSHQDMYPLFNDDGSSGQQPQISIDKNGVVHQPPIMYIAERSSHSRELQQQQASPRTPIPEHEHGQYPQ